MSPAHSRAPLASTSPCLSACRIRRRVGSAMACRARSRVASPEDMDAIGIALKSMSVNVKKTPIAFCFFSAGNQVPRFDVQCHIGVRALRSGPTVTALSQSFLRGVKHAHSPISRMPVSRNELQCSEASGFLRHVAHQSRQSGSKDISSQDSSRQCALDTAASARSTRLSRYDSRGISLKLQAAKPEPPPSIRLIPAARKSPTQYPMPRAVCVPRPPTGTMETGHGMENAEKRRRVHAGNRHA